MAHLVEFGGVITSALSPGRVEAPETPGSLTRAFRRAVSNLMSRFSVGVPWVEVLGTDGVRSQNRKISQGLMKMRNC